MKKILCIFAHPDDEAFGPAGTIALLSQTHEVYLLCVTNGNAGKNHTPDERELHAIRKEEMQKSAKILGVKQVFFLGYNDGKLCNELYHSIAKDINGYIDTIKPDILMTFEYRGFLGHIDHIAVSMITSYIYETNSLIRKIMYYCISEENRALHKPYFIYIPPGYKRAEIDEVYDVSQIWAKKIASMQAHQSQKHDFERFIEVLNNSPKEEYFLVKEKQ